MAAAGAAVAAAAREGSRLVVLPEYVLLRASRPSACGSSRSPWTGRASTRSGGWPARPACASSATCRVWGNRARGAAPGESPIFDTTVVVAPDGELLTAYDKTHLFDREKAVFTPGAALEPPFVWARRALRRARAASTSSFRSRRARSRSGAPSACWCRAPTCSRGDSTTAPTCAHARSRTTPSSPTPTPSDPRPATCSREAAAWWTRSAGSSATPAVTRPSCWGGPRPQGRGRVAGSGGLPRRAAAGAVRLTPVSRRA